SAHARDGTSSERRGGPVYGRCGGRGAPGQGAVRGQTGFRLSLFGSDPAFDHEQVVRALAGRRVNRFDPAGSLLLLKATGRASHGGGVRLRPGGFEYEGFRRWLAAGAPAGPGGPSAPAEPRRSPPAPVARPPP